METAGERKYIRTWVSADGKHAHASISTKPGAGDEEQPYDTDNGRYMSFTVGPGGGISGGNEVRGKVTPPQKLKYPPPPPAPKEPHLVYSQKSGELAGPDGALLGKGYAGQKEGKNNPDAEADKGFGPIPQGNWRILGPVDKPALGPDPVYKLEPDPETAERVKAMGRDPDSFYVHAKATRPERQGNGDSQGCIAMDKPDRKALKQHVGRWIHVTK